LCFTWSVASVLLEPQWTITSCQPFPQTGPFYITKGCTSLRKKNISNRSSCCTTTDWTLATEAKKISSQLEEATELEASTYIHLCIGDSAKVRQQGDCLWRAATCRKEEIQMELTWDANDCYLQSIVLSRSKCLESEARAHSQLGRLYELLVSNEKSRDHYKLTIQLAMAMHPKICKN
jgi:hypothetical protein